MVQKGGAPTSPPHLSAQLCPHAGHLCGGLCSSGCRGGKRARHDQPLSAVIQTGGFCAPFLVTCSTGVGGHHQGYAGSQRGGSQAPRGALAPAQVEISPPAVRHTGQLGPRLLETQAYLSEQISSRSDPT